MPEWLVERGIGETRAALVAGGEIIETRIELASSIPAGSVVTARLMSIGSNGRNAVAVAEGGDEYLLPKGAPGITEGAVVTLEVAREAIPGAEPWKRPLARMTDEPPRAAPSLSERLDARELGFPAPRDELGQAGWNDLLEEARTGMVAFAGGRLRISPTPAMTLIDVDGFLPPEELAVAGARETAKVLCRLDIGGSIGIDLPTTASKAARQAAAAAIDTNLPQPFERTAVNGFGFVQVVRPWRRASLVQLAQDRAAFETRVLLRGAAFEHAGGKRIVAQPAIIALLELRREWIDMLSLQVGGTIELRADTAVPMSGGYVENL